MHPLLKRSQFWIANLSVFFLLLAALVPSAATASKSLAPSPLTGVRAEGGYEFAWVYWDTPTPKLRRTIDSYTIVSLPDKASHKCPTSTIDRCRVKISNPWDGKGSEPDAWGYSFKVGIDGDIASGWSATSNTVYMTFPKKKIVVNPVKTPTVKVSATPSPSRTPTLTSTPSRTPTPTPTPSRTPTPSPTPSQTPTPTPKAPSISDYDGSYSGSLNISLTPAILPPQVIPFSLKLLNGSGQGQGGSWRGSGVVNDTQGNAIVTIANAIYGSFSVPITFSLNGSNQKKTGTGSGRHTVLVRGFGEITFDFTFNVATK